MNHEQLSAEINTYKGQLDTLLALKFVDQSFLLGLNSRIQSKFQTWILADFKQYLGLIEGNAALSSTESNQLPIEFTTIAYFTTLWSDFHYSVIKFFQEQHVAFMLETNKQFKESKNTGKSTSFNVRAVEIRKINENATKFAKQAMQFYYILIKHFATHYLNPLLPRRLVSFFRLSPVTDAIQVNDVNAQTNLLYLIHRCVLALGDISRHRAFVEVSIVDPCLSRRAFFENKALTPQARSEAYMPRYQKAVQYYKMCILLLPALNEPYNHLGVINNHLDEKFSACLWFLRSQLTRLANFQLGLNNLQSVLEKHFFVSELQYIDMDAWKSGATASAANLETVLICLVGYYFLPGLYRKGRTSFHQMPIATAENVFRSATRARFGQLIVTETDHGNFFVKQLTVLFSLLKLIETHTLNNNLLGPDELFTQLGLMTFRYVDMVLDGIVEVGVDSHGYRVDAMITVRYIMNWLVENKSMYKLFLSRKSTASALRAAVNTVAKLLSKQDSEIVKKVIESGSRPVRSHYFSEDVLFRDFLVVNYQLKDFKDDHLFSPNNPDLLLGDFSSLRCAIGAALFLPKPVGPSPAPVAPMVATYECECRAKSCLVLSKKLFQSKPFGISFDAVTQQYLQDSQDADVTSKLQMRDSQRAEALLGDKNSYALMARSAKKQTKSSSVKVPAAKKGPFPGVASANRDASLQNTKSPQKSRVPDSSIADVLVNEPVVQVPNSTQEILSQSTVSQANASSSLEEIQLFILSHTSNFPVNDNDAGPSKSQGVEDNLREVNLEEMVDGLVEEPAGNGNGTRISPLPIETNIQADLAHSQQMHLGFGEGVNWGNRPSGAPAAVAPSNGPSFHGNEMQGYHAGYYQGAPYQGCYNGNDTAMGPGQGQYPPYGAPGAYPGPGQYGWPPQPPLHNQYMMQAPIYGGGPVDPNAFNGRSAAYAGYGMPGPGQGMQEMYVPTFGDGDPRNLHDLHSGPAKKPGQS